MKGLFSEPKYNYTCKIRRIIKVSFLFCTDKIIQKTLLSYNLIRTHQMRINIVPKGVQDFWHGKLYVCTIYILCTWKNFLHPLLIWKAWQSCHFFSHQNTVDPACHAGLTRSRKPISSVGLCSSVLPCPPWQGEPHVLWQVWEWHLPKQLQM